MPQDVFEAKLVATYRAAAPSLAKLGRAAFIQYTGGIHHKSNEWVLNLAREWLPDDPTLRLPLIDTHDVRSPGGAGLYQSGAVYDDASFTGHQAAGLMEEGHRLFGMQRMVVAIAYMTRFAIDHIQQRAEQLSMELELYTAEVIPDMRESLEPDTYRALQRRLPDYLHGGQSLTYFAHKVPDERSLYPIIGRPHILGLQRVEPLLKSGIAVYHEAYLGHIGHLSANQS